MSNQNPENPHESAIESDPSQQEEQRKKAYQAFFQTFGIDHEFLKGLEPAIQTGDPFPPKQKQIIEQACREAEKLAGPVFEPNPQAPPFARRINLVLSVLSNWGKGLEGTPDHYVSTKQENTLDVIKGLKEILG